MWSFAVLGGCVVLIALLAAYVPTIYIRKTNKLLNVLEQIAANTGEPPQHPARTEAGTYWRSVRTAGN
jgi:hypothetical protein